MSRVRQASVALALLIVGVFTGGWLDLRNAPPSEVPFHFIQGTAPVVVSIQYRPEISEPLENVAQLSGVATYKFTNLTNESINLSFPPVRVFGFDVGHVGTAEVPAFMAEKRIVTISAGQSVQFDDNQAMTLSGDDALTKFLRGGPGWSGFVFERPVEDVVGTSYCSGTLFANYSVQLEEQSQADREEQQRADAHQVSLALMGYKSVTPQKPGPETDQP